MRARVKQTTTWISKSKTEIENEEEILACRRIILKIVRYMKDNKMNQKDLAEKLNVSPQYINKLLHGQNVDLKITTALRYGRILGIKLIQLPEEVPASHSVTINYYQTSAPVKRTDGCAFIYHQGIAVVVNLSYDDSSTSDILSALAIILREGLYKLGASNVIQDFMQLPQAYSQAAAALELGKKSGSMIWCYRFDDYILDYMLEQSTTQISPELLCHQSLSILKKI